MAAAARDNAIKSFNEDPDCWIFLTGLKSGAASLSLLLASNVSHYKLKLLFCMLNHATQLITTPHVIDIHRNSIHV